MLATSTGTDFGFFGKRKASEAPVQSPDKLFDERFRVDLQFNGNFAVVDVISAWIFPCSIVPLLLFPVLTVVDVVGVEVGHEDGTITPTRILSCSVVLLFFSVMRTFVSMGTNVARGVLDCIFSRCTFLLLLLLSVTTFEEGEVFELMPGTVVLSAFFGLSTLVVVFFAMKFSGTIILKVFTSLSSVLRIARLAMAFRRGLRAFPPALPCDFAGSVTASASLVSDTASFESFSETILSLDKHRS
jgi:hypothetical protein